MNPNHLKGIQTTGFQTSLELAQKQGFPTKLVAGTKRSRSDHEVSTSFTSARRLFQTEQNRTTGPQRRAGTIPIHPSKRRLIASEIRTLPSAALPDEDCVTYSQRKAVSSTPGPSGNPLLSLRHPNYGLPESLVANFEVLGVNCIYPWQASCLMGHGHLTAKKNLVYSAPTGGGKSLVADVLILKRIIDNPGMKAILVLPYVALVQEKLKWLRRLAEGVERRPDAPSGNDAPSTRPPSRSSKMSQNSIRVTGFFGGSKSRATWSDTDIAVCTIEKVGMFKFWTIARHWLDIGLRG